MVFWWKVYVCPHRHFLQICQWPSYSSGCVRRCETTVSGRNVAVANMSAATKAVFSPCSVPGAEMGSAGPRKHGNWDVSEPDGALHARWSAAALKPPASRQRLPPTSADLRNCGTCVHKGPFIGVRVCSLTQDRCVLVAVKHVSSLPLRSFCKGGPLPSVLCDSAASVNGKRV